MVFFCHLKILNSIFVKKTISDWFRLKVFFKKTCITMVPVLKGK